MSKFIARLLRHSKQVRRKKMEESFMTISPLLRIGHLKMDISSGERWRTAEKVPVLLEPELFSEIPVLSSNPRTFRKYNQSCIARQCTVTRRFYRVKKKSRRKRKRNEVNSESWFDSRRSQSQNRQTSCSSLL